MPYGSYYHQLREEENEEEEKIDENKGLSKKTRNILLITGGSMIGLSILLFIIYMIMKRKRAKYDSGMSELLMQANY